MSFFCRSHTTGPKVHVYMRDLLAPALKSHRRVPSSSSCALPRTQPLFFSLFPVPRGLLLSASNPEDMKDASQLLSHTQSLLGDSLTARRRRQTYILPVPGLSVSGCAALHLLPPLSLSLPPTPTPSLPFSPQPIHSNPFPSCNSLSHSITLSLSLFLCSLV